jgi:hypothetical protein
METLTVCLPDVLAQAVAHDATLAGLAPAEVGLQALREYCQRRVQGRALALYVEEAARGYASPAVREEAVAVADSRIAKGFCSEGSKITRPHQQITDDGPKFPNPWLVRRIAELQSAKTPRAARALLLPFQSI